MDSLEVVSFVADLFELEDKPKSLVFLPGMEDRAWLDALPEHHRYVAVADNLETSRGSGVACVGQPFYRAAPFTSDFAIGATDRHIIEAPMLPLKCPQPDGLPPACYPGTLLSVTSFR